MNNKFDNEMDREYALYHQLAWSAFFLLLVLLGFAFFDTDAGVHKDIEIARIQALYHQDGGR